MRRFVSLPVASCRNGLSLKLLKNLEKCWRDRRDSNSRPPA